MHQSLGLRLKELVSASVPRYIQIYSEMIERRDEFQGLIKRISQYKYDLHDASASVRIFNHILGRSSMLGRATRCKFLLQSCSSLIIRIRKADKILEESGSYSKYVEVTLPLVTSEQFESQNLKDIKCVTAALTLAKLRLGTLPKVRHHQTCLEKFTYLHVHAHIDTYMNKYTTAFKITLYDVNRSVKIVSRLISHFTWVELFFSLFSDYSLQRYIRGQRASAESNEYRRSENSHRHDQTSISNYG